MNANVPEPKGKCHHQSLCRKTYNLSLIGNVFTQTLFLFAKNGRPQECKNSCVTLNV